MIKPLSKENLVAAQDLLRLVFTDKEEADGGCHYFAVSLNPYRESYFEYWVLDVGGKIVGTTGLYYDDTTPNDLWLGWFCVHPDFRRKGYGTMLLQFSIQKARQAKATRLRLWTTNAPDTAVATELYRHWCFTLDSVEPMADTQYHILKYSLGL